MDYKRLIKALKCDGYSVGQDNDGCTNKRCGYRDSAGACNIVSMCDDAATAITDLLARAEAAEKERDEEKSKVDEYADSARAIALWLAGFCDRSLSYPQMISNAARKIALAYADMEKRAEARCETLEKIVKEYQEELIPGYREQAEKAERERDAYKADLEFYREGCHRLSLELDEYEKGE